MTDEQIKKALKYCQDTEGDSCQCCEYLDVPGCQMELSKDAFDLINRQQAEIERLKKGWKADVIETQNIKAEAIKEFVQRLKEHLKGYGGLYCVTTMNAHIDNLVKEMVGGGK